MAPDQPATAEDGHEPLQTSTEQNPPTRPRAQDQVPASAAAQTAGNVPPDSTPSASGGFGASGSAQPALDGIGVAGSAQPAPGGIGVPGSVQPAPGGIGVAGSAAPAAKASRAGRDLRSAIGVGLALGAVVLVSLLTVRQIFIGVIAAAVAMATIELAGALRRSVGINVALVPVLVGGQAMVWLSWPWGATLCSPRSW